ncbi:MAG TPA: PEPxxWA-CTERM sorting domain-containing protein [Sphingomonas sp.]|nr:PEPxxWA-CTERM sorting domain-containing protein [Sphingomonas sp.]
MKLAAAFALVALGSAATLGEGMLNAGVAAARDMVDAVGGRSPGERTQASMTKGKPRIAVDRVARALPRIRDARASSQPPAAPAAAAAAPAALGAPAAEAAPAFVASPSAFAETPGGVFVGSPGPGGVFVPSLPGGGGGGGGPILIVPPGETPPGTETPPTVTPPVVTAPIPEPATWAMMLLGFGAAGAAMRTRRLVGAHSV